MHMYCKHSELIYLNMLLKNVQLCLNLEKMKVLLKTKDKEKKYFFVRTLKKIHKKYLFTLELR